MKPALHPVFISFKLDPKDLLLIRCLLWHPAELTGSSSTLPAPNVFSEGLRRKGQLWLAVLHFQGREHEREGGRSLVVKVRNWRLQQPPLA